MGCLVLLWHVEPLMQRYAAQVRAQGGDHAGQRGMFHAELPDGHEQQELVGPQAPLALEKARLPPPRVRCFFNIASTA